MDETENLCERLRANDPDYRKIDMFELYGHRSNESGLLNLTAALENNTVVSEVLLDVCGFTEESANAMENFLRASNSLRKVVLGRSIAWSIADPGVLQQQQLILCILLRALLCSKSVKEIRLDRIDFGACDKVFDDLLSCAKSLQKLTLVLDEDAGLSPKAATTIANSLTRSATVKDLHLAWWPESSLIPFLTGLRDNSILDSLYLQGVQSLTGLDLLLQSKGCGISKIDISCRSDNVPTTWDSRSLPSLEPLFRGIQRNTTVTKLTITGYSLRLDHAAQLKSMLYKNTVLQHLNGSGTGLGSAGLAEIAAGLYRNTTLQHLSYLSGNDLGDLTSAKTLKDLLRRNKSLTTLYIEDIPFGCTLGTAECIAQGLSGSRSLQTISLSNCMLGDRDISALAKGLGSCNKTLRTLFLCNNQITSTGLGVLLDLVAEKLPIARLLLSQNSLGRAGANVIASALGRNTVPNLKELFIKDCGVDDEGLQEIASALERNNTLKAIALIDNVFSEAGVMALAGSLPNIRTLDCIDLSWNDSVSASMPILMEGLRKNKSLQNIVFDGGPSGEWSQELVFLQYRNRFHRLIKPTTTTIANSLTRSATVKELSLVRWPESSLIPFLAGLQNHSVVDWLNLQCVQSLTGLDLLLQSKGCGISTLVIKCGTDNVPTTWDSQSLPSLEPLVRGIQRNATVTDLTIAG
jgi:Ran GTPase-activating protein (RanGAP) involved in mRNA processing and transport